MSDHAPPSGFRYIGHKRSPVEDRRFVAGAGRFAADIQVPGLKHATIVSSPYPAARIVSIDTSEALAMPGVRAVLTGEDLAAATDPIVAAVDAPMVRRWALAVGQARYAGEWLVAVVADTRAQAEDAAEAIDMDLEPLDHVLDAEEAVKPDSPPVHPDHGSNVLVDRRFVWGDVEGDFKAAPHTLGKQRCHWGRSSTVPIETFVSTARWDPWTEQLDVWASIQMPKFADQVARALRLPMSAVRVHNDIDVGGSYGVKRGLKHTVLVGELARRIGAPVRLIEDRLQNMTGGDAHGPDRIFEFDAAFEDDGRITAWKLRALDNVGAHALRAPYQLGKPVSAIVGPYAIGSVEYHAQSVTTNVTPQEAVRGFGQAPTNYAMERMLDLVAARLGLDRLAVRRRNLIPAEAFPYQIPSGSVYDSGDYQAMMDKLLARAGGWEALLAERETLRKDGWLAGLGIATCLEPSGGNSTFEALLNPKTSTTTYMEACQIAVDAAGCVTATLSTTTSGQGHETLLCTVVGEVLHIPPEQIRVARATSQSGHATNSPVGSRMAIMLGGAAAEAARNIVSKLLAIGAHEFGLPGDQVAWRECAVHADDGSGRQLSWAELVNICHRHAHRLAPGQEPGLSAVHTLQVPRGGGLPDADGRVQIYPCYAFEAHLVLLRMDPVLCRPEFVRYLVGHDCGTIINPDIVHGMTLGGIAHGIGAAFMERFEVSADGQPQAVTLLDYPMPSSHEVPEIEIVTQVTPSPFTAFGQKGSGESGYLGSPAALSGAINDAIAPLGTTINALPMRMSHISDIVAAARERT